MKHIQLYLSISLITILCGCESKLGMWNNQSEYLYFMGDTVISKTFIFDSEKVIDDTIYLEVKTIGNTSSENRPFSIKQIQIGNEKNAIEGTHFMALNSPEMKRYLIIKAGESSATIPLIIYRHTSLKGNSYVAKFELEEREGFKHGIISDVSRKVYISDTYEKPSGWTNWLSSYALGEYSKVKHKFMHKALAVETNYLPDNNFLREIEEKSSYIYYKSYFQKYLNQYNKEHLNNPLMSEPMLPDYPKGKPISF